MGETGNQTPEEFQNLTSPETGKSTEREVNPLTWEQLTGFENPNHDEYQQIISTQNSGVSDYGTGRRLWGGIIDSTKRFEGLKPLYNFLEERLNNKIVIALGDGGGESSMDLAKEFGASHYINVDHQLPYGLVDRGTVNKLEHRDEKALISELRDGLHIYRIEEDMLDFLQRVPSNTGNIIINGIDLFLLNNPVWGGQISDIYHRALTNEYARVVGNGCLAFGAGGSNSLYSLRNYREFSEIDTSNHDKYDPDELNPLESADAVLFAKESPLSIPGLYAFTSRGDKTWTPEFKWQ